ncbi:lysosome-associated membrane glycoprotein 1-like isoform X2 [Pseudomyrmex gracilis]|uniref:lysosome-associated membrane glycoprotein 1-like isoform X2 n=1 Tax=Pseudomyrmex gracilis TaxID=219809 RepID=UPI0009957BD2|nr:lysosome-associated membrane glycoprotein 1-like isoform X2 [Pseudomyrmex gracilis]
MLLKPVLLLCWTLAIVSADTGVRSNAADGDVSAITSETYKPPVSTNDAQTDVNVDVKTPPNADPKESSSVSPHTTKPTISTTTSHITTTPSTTTTSTTTSATTTTTANTTTTTLAPTTPAPITPLPPPSTGKWTLKDKNSTVCIIVQMAAQFNISYTNANNVTISKAMDVPSNSNYTGDCGKTEQNLTLSWKSHNNSNSQNNFTLHFVKNETDKHYSLHHLEISLAPQEFPSNTTNKTVTVVHMAPQFDTGLSNSYRCLKEQSLNLTLPNNNATIGHIKVSHLQFQAFRGDNTTVFGLAKDCSFDTPDIVPITVGCALAALVFIVLVAYLFGRRRSQTRGYLSM